MSGLKQSTVWRDRLAAIPVVRSGLSLMTGTVITSGLGLVFWVLAARLYRPEDFGVATTAVYTMMMLADVACIGLRTGLVRYLPIAGRRTPGTIALGYGVAVSASLAIGTVFLLGLDLWARDLDALRAALLLAVFFVAGTAFWALFMLEDSVLVGLRKAPWVPIENTLFGLAKIALLFPFASLSPTLGIFWAWTIPVFPIVVGVNALVARLVRSTAGPAPEPPPSLRRDLMSFSLADWVAALARLAALGVIPLMVLAQEGKAAAGYFQAAWLIAFTTFALSSNAADALLAESSYERTRLDRNSFHAGALALTLTAPIIVVGVIGAPLLLLIYGDDYAANSSAVLRILLPAAISNAVYQIFIGRLRSKNRIGQVVLFETLLAVLVVGLASLLLPRYGIEGVGVAWLVGLTLVATNAMVVESRWWWASWIDTATVRRLGAVRRAARRRRPGRRPDPPVDAVLDLVGVAGAVGRWRRIEGDVQALVVTGRRGPDLVVELAATPAGVDAVMRRRRAVQRLTADPSLSEMHPLLPTIHAAGDGPPAHTAWVATPGIRASEVVAGGAPIEVVVSLILDALEPMHRATARTVVVTEADVDRWAEPSIGYLSTVGHAAPAALDRLRRLLNRDLVGASVEVATLHGRPTLYTTFLATDPLVVTGLVEWGFSDERPTVLDAATLALTALASSSGRELGEIVVDLLDDPGPFETHPAVARRSTAPLSPVAVVLLAWLRLVGHPRAAGEVMSSDEFWLARNARPVLATLAACAGDLAADPEAKVGAP